MPDEKVYLAGPWGGEDCCYCCYRCSTEHEGHYNNCTGCPPLCCTCPPLCDLEVVITATCCAGMNGQTFELKKADWDDFTDHYCYTDNPSSANAGGTPCYLAPELCPYWGRQHPYEKWANKTGSDWGACFCDNEPTHDSDGDGVACDSDPDRDDGNAVNCDGVWMIFSLCCCDVQAAATSNDLSDYEGECKTCSYQFRTNWSSCPGVTPPQGAGYVCSCYDGMGGMGLSTEAIPPDQNAEPGHGEGLSMVWEHVAGDCSYQDDPAEPFDPSNWRMEYKLGDAANPLYWNCDCCFNTEVVGGIPPYVRPKKSVYFTAVITPVDDCEKGGP